MIKLNLLVLRCKNIETSKSFYEKLGLKFKKEKHGTGIEHYSAYVDDVVMELYPLRDGEGLENLRLGFLVESKYIDGLRDEVILKYEFDDQELFVLKDPDSRKVELRELSKS